MPAAQRMTAAVLGMLTVLVALVLAALAAGPSLRAVLGPPAGFGSDVTSRDAYLQALAAQVICTALAFSLLGMLLGRWTSVRLWRSALWVANPLTVGMGYWLFRQISAPSWPYEYMAYHGWLVLSLLAPIVLAPFVCLGARFRKSGG